MGFSDTNNFARSICGLPPSYHADMRTVDAHRPKRPRFVADFDTTVAGIPCGIRIDSVVIQKAQPWNDSSDWDCQGYEEIDYTVLDSKGYEAPWLAKKLTKADEVRIEGMILDKEFAA